jgi:hypothetical protein
MRATVPSIRLGGRLLLAGLLIGSLLRLSPVAESQSTPRIHRIGFLGAARSRLPAIGFSEIAGAGALMSYGVSFPALWRQAATFVDRILKGAKPSDIPIEQPSRFELMLNLKAAKALGVQLPPAVLARADGVIQ